MDSQKRFLVVDTLRGFAIFLMIIYHFCFDLNYFGFVHFDIYNKEGRFWFYFSRVTLSIFLYCVGTSLVLAHPEKINWRKVLKRFLLLLGASILISVVSFQIFPKSWIYFGVIHFITIASILGLLFIRSTLLSIIAAVTLFLIYYFDVVNPHFMFEPFREYLPRYTEDRVPLLPWMIPVLVGIVAARLKWQHKIRQPIHPFSLGLAWGGRHALIIYLLHQPILFAFLGGISKLLG